MLQHQVVCESSVYILSSTVSHIMKDPELKLEVFAHSLMWKFCPAHLLSLPLPNYIICCMVPFL